MTADQLIERQAEKLLKAHPHFCGRGQFFELKCSENCLTLGGCLPTYYLKQLAQEAVRSIQKTYTKLRIDNQIVVRNPRGGVRHQRYIGPNREGLQPVTFERPDRLHRIAAKSASETPKPIPR